MKSKFRANVVNTYKTQSSVTQLSKHCENTFAPALYDKENSHVNRSHVSQVTKHFQDICTKCCSTLNPNANVFTLCGKHYVQNSNLDSKLNPNASHFKSNELGNGQHWILNPESDSYLDISINVLNESMQNDDYNSAECSF